MTIRSVICATGAYLPKNVVSNKDLEEIVDTSDEWIVQRSGIEQRYIAQEETTGDMAIEAGRMALERSGLSPEDIDTVIVGTTTPDDTFPALATKVQAALGFPPGIAFDVQAVCSGFVYALSTANNFIVAGQSKRALVIGADKMSSLLNWEDRTTCVLFGDGAGAVIIEADDEATGDINDRGILSTHLYANGTQRDLLYVDGGPGTTKTTGQLIMQGREIFKYAVNYMVSAVQEALDQYGLAGEDVDWLVPHQANSRIIEAVAKKLGIRKEQVVITVAKHGNTSAASIPLAFHEAVADGRIQKGQLVLMEAMGGGLTWGSVLIRF